MVPPSMPGRFGPHPQERSAPSRPRLDRYPTHYLSKSPELPISFQLSMAATRYTHPQSAPETRTWAFATPRAPFEDAAHGFSHIPRQPFDSQELALPPWAAVVLRFQ